MIKKMREFFKKSVPFSQTLPRWQEQQPAFRQFDNKTAVEYGYKKSAIVYSCINLIAKSAASVEWKAYKKTSTGAWQEIQEHPMAALISNPNPHMSRKDFIERMTHGLYLGGNAIFSKIRAKNGAVLELWPLDQDNIKIMPSRTDFIDHYLYEAHGQKFKIEPNDIIHNQFLNPSNMYWGLAPIRAAAAIIDTDNEAIKWNFKALQNRAISDGAFIFNEPLTREQWEEARKQIEEQHSGADNARKFWVLGSGSEWKQMSLSPQEMDFIESRRFSRTEICSIFQVPPPLISIYDDATLANIQTARKIFWLDTLIPYLEDIKSCLNSTLSNDFGGDVVLDFDISKVDAIQENTADKIDNAKNLFAMGVPFNNINSRLNLGFDEIEGGDIGYLPSNLVPADLFNDMQQPAQNNNNAQQEANNEAQDDDDNEPKGNGAKKETKATKAVNLINEAHRDFYWKSFERKRVAHDLAMTRKAAAIFKEQGKAAQQAFENGEDVDKAIEKAAKEPFLKLYERTFKNIIEEIAPQQYEALMQQAKAAHGYDIKADEDEDAADAFNPYEQSIIKYIVETTALKVTNVLEFTKSEIAALIFDLREQEKTTAEIGQAIYNKFEDFSRYRAYRIARTEVAAYSNHANFEAGNQAAERLDRRGIKVYKVWVTARDSRVRDSHAALEGKTVGIKDGFDFGDDGALNYPAEYEAEMPHNTINCRCTIAYETRRD